MIFQLFDLMKSCVETIQEKKITVFNRFLLQRHLKLVKKRVKQIQKAIFKKKRKIYGKYALNGIPEIHDYDDDLDDDDDDDLVDHDDDDDDNDS